MSLIDAFKDIYAKKEMVYFYPTTNTLVNNPQIVYRNNTYFVSASQKPGILYIVNGTDDQQTLNINFNILNDGNAINSVHSFDTKSETSIYDQYKNETISETKDILLQPKGFLFVSSVLGPDVKTSTGNITLKINGINTSKNNNSNNVNNTTPQPSIVKHYFSIAAVVVFIIILTILIIFWYEFIKPNLTKEIE